MNERLCCFTKQWSHKLLGVGGGVREELLHILVLSLLSAASLYSQSREVSSTHTSATILSFIISLLALPITLLNTTQNHLRLPYHFIKNKFMAPRVCTSKKAASKAPAKTHRTRRQRRNEQLVIRNIPVLPPTFRCWFCVGEKRLGEKVPYSRTLPICHNCQGHYTSVASQRATDTHPAASISGSASRSALPSSSSPPRPAHLVFPSHPLRPAVIIDSGRGLKKKIILRLKAPSTKPGAPTSNEGHKRRKRIILRLSAPKAPTPEKPDSPMSNEGWEEKRVRLRLTAPKQRRRPILFVCLQKSTGEDGRNILLRFSTPLRKIE